MERKSLPMISSYEQIIPQITIREVCEILNIPLPNVTNCDCIDDIEIDKVTTASISTWSMKNRSIAFLKKNGIDVYRASNSNASMIISDVAYRNTGAYSVRLPDNMSSIEAYVKVCAHIRSKYNIPNIAITGNAGKTTTKDLIGIVLSHYKNTLYVNKNYNTIYTVGEIIQSLNHNHELYIQEVHEPHASSCSMMLKPNVVVFTNLERAHLDETGSSKEASIKATLRLIDNMNPDGMIFANFDCPNLSKESFDERNVIRYSANSPKADYWAEDIINSGEYTTFKICNKNEEPVECKLFISGVHNVNNAVCAYAVGRYFSVNPEDIVQALQQYRPSGIRQNLMHNGNQNILVDCYSITGLSLFAASKTLCDIPLNNGGKRILISSYIPTLGSSSESVHREIARKVAELPIDLVIGYRNDSKYFIDELQKCGKNAVFFQYHREVIEYLKNTVGANDTIAFKGGTASHLEQVVNAVFNLDIKPENTMESDRKKNGGDF